MIVLIITVVVAPLSGPGIIPVAKLVERADQINPNREDDKYQWTRNENHPISR
jgi:hypothetical protein